MKGSTVLGWLATALGTVAVPLALYTVTTERYTAGAASLVDPLATPDDLVLIDAEQDGKEDDPAGLMRPFGSKAVVVVDPAGPLPDLSTFPHPQFFLIGRALTPARLGLAGGVPLSPDVTLVKRTPHGVPLESLMERLTVSVEKDGNAQACKPKHLSGGLRCGRQPWQYVAPVVVKANDRLVSCLWVHPVHEHTLHLDFPVSGTVDANLWLQFVDDAMLDVERPAVTLTMEAHGGTVGRVQCTNRRPGRCTLSARVESQPTSSAPNTPALRVSLSTLDAARQLLCLGGALVEAS
jgi:hypothetical protein